MIRVRANILSVSKIDPLLTDINRHLSKNLYYRLMASWHGHEPLSSVVKWPVTGLLSFISEQNRVREQA